MRKEFLSELQCHIPGKSVEQIGRQFHLSSEAVRKLHMNENLYWPNVYGLSPRVRRAIVKNIDHINDYLANEGELCKAISNYTKIPARNIMIGAGIDGVLGILTKMLLEKDDEVIIPVPTYGMFEFITRINSGTPKFIQRDENLHVPIPLVISAINSKTKLLFLCSPNNTTGDIIKKQQLEAILKKTKVFVVVDEALGEFAENSLTPLIKKYENLIVLRTLSKAFGLAALRIGYGMTLSPEVLEGFNRTRPPFSINSLGAKVAIAAFNDRSYLKRVVQKIKEGREYILKGVKFKTYFSQANFVLVNVAPLRAKDVLSWLLQQGILVRDCDSSERLREHFIRIKVGKMSQNKAIVKAINAIYDENFHQN